MRLLIPSKTNYREFFLEEYDVRRNIEWICEQHHRDSAAARRMIDCPSRSVMRLLVLTKIRYRENILEEVRRPTMFCPGRMTQG